MKITELTKFNVTEMTDHEQDNIVGGSLWGFIEDAVEVTVKTLAYAAKGLVNGIEKGYNYVTDMAK